MLSQWRSSEWVCDARELFVGPFEQQRRACPILDISRVHLGSKDQATGIDQDVAFATIEAFRAVVAADAADWS